MIYLYTNKPCKDCILKNDLYFNLYTGNQPFTEEDRKAMWMIDRARLTKDHHIETRFGIGTVRELSTGCKTYLNVQKNPGKIISAEECGGNVLTMLFKLKECHIYMSYPERFEIDKDVKIRINDEETVIGRKGYEKWWSLEYRRRAENDF